MCWWRLKYFWGTSLCTMVCTCGCRRFDVASCFFLHGSPSPEWHLPWKPEKLKMKLLWNMNILSQVSDHSALRASRGTSVPATLGEGNRVLGLGIRGSGQVPCHHLLYNVTHGLLTWYEHFSLLCNSLFFIVLGHCNTLCYCFSSVFCTVHCTCIVVCLFVMYVMLP
jgi:hypothetical protein